jgi:hypothetical protein
MPVQRGKQFCLSFLVSLRRRTYRQHPRLRGPDRPHRDFTSLLAFRDRIPALLTVFTSHPIQRRLPILERVQDPGDCEIDGFLRSYRRAHTAKTTTTSWVKGRRCAALAKVHAAVVQHKNSISCYEWSHGIAPRTPSRWVRAL